ncbi:Cupredoxin [Mycotypha africana]|uniref:Cupredoxin n=1 Tax=Mycotypha africana TaxID=64632 RepID=UPI002300699F|nr:Cupredoxin [Mycotypha africana]KAI8991409.1 Cupredoxin [Mycotypha africana]
MLLQINKIYRLLVPLIFQQLLLLILTNKIVQAFPASGDTIRRFDFHIESTKLNPDCHNESYSALVINGQYPGPTLRVVKNDIIELHIKNDAANNVSTSIHFHGIRQLGSPSSDGVAGITQLGIAPGEDYIQRFQIIDQSGTFYYHAHVGVQDDTIQGAFIVYENEACLNNNEDENDNSATFVSDGPFEYDGEFILHWSEWWHQSFHDREAFYMNHHFPGDSGPDSILLNGRSIYQNTSDINEPHTLSENCQGFTYFDVEPNKVYRLRFIGAMTFRILGFVIPDHTMKLIEIDGEYVKPHAVDYLEVGPGQRMSVLIQTGDYSPGTTFPISSGFVWRIKGPKGYTKNGYGFLRYVAPKNDLKELGWSAQKEDAAVFVTTPLIGDLPQVLPPVEAPGWVLQDVEPVRSDEEYHTAILSRPANRTIKISMGEVTLPDNTTRYVYNNLPYVHHPWGNDSMPLLQKVTADPSFDLSASFTSVDGYSMKHHTFNFHYKEVVDVVFQNVETPHNGLCVAHPWHTHGYSHYLLAEGAGDYQHDVHKDIQTYPNPLYKDVSMVYNVYSNDTSANTNGGCGWTKVRIYMDNPGVWAVHCHITAHMLQGKMVVFEVAPQLIDEAAL